MSYESRHVVAGHVLSYAEGNAGKEVLFVNFLNASFEGERHLLHAANIPNVLLIIDPDGNGMQDIEHFF